VTRYIYSARLVPIGKPVRIPFEDGSPPEPETFTDESFEIERTSKTKPAIWLEHDKGLRIGQAVVLYRHEGWWCADFALDADVPDDITFEVGQKVSVGLSRLKIGSGGAFLREISIVRHGAVERAEITRRFGYEPAVSTTTTPAEPPMSPLVEAAPDNVLLLRRWRVVPREHHVAVGVEDVIEVRVIPEKRFAQQLVPGHASLCVRARAVERDIDLVLREGDVVSTWSIGEE